MNRHSVAHLLIFLSFIASAVSSAWAAEPLPALAVEEPVTVSGLSSGAFMAVQLHVAHSNTVKGAGIVAGGPYYCAENSLAEAMSVCMDPNAFLAPDPDVYIRQTKKEAEKRRIDDPAGLKDGRVWLLSGGKDSTVNTRVVDKLYLFYRNFMPAASMVYERIPDAGHAMITPEDAKASPCEKTQPPYINRCDDFDAPGRLLEHLLGPLRPKAEKATGELVEFDQRPYLGGLASDAQAIKDRSGMAQSGYLYIPTGCRSGGCRVHVALHGCKQSAQTLGDQYVRQGGYNRWAESNRLVILYPQTVASMANPNGCWDWWGYSGDDYYLKKGRQISAIKSMIDRLQAAPQ